MQPDALPLALGQRETDKRFPSFLQYAPVRIPLDLPHGRSDHHVVQQDSQSDVALPVHRQRLETLKKKW
jgi:hypothetical protein